MPTLEVFFDYACPYCLAAHRELECLRDEFPAVEFLWRPCEAHPRPGRYGPHSDLCARALLFAVENGADPWQVHTALYTAALSSPTDVEDPAAVAACLAHLVSEAALLQALRAGAHADALARNNRLAWGQYALDAVPSLHSGGKWLKSVEDIGLTRAAMAGFLRTLQ